MYEPLNDDKGRLIFFLLFYLENLTTLTSYPHMVCSNIAAFNYVFLSPNIKEEILSRAMANSEVLKNIYGSILKGAKTRRDATPK